MVANEAQQMFRLEYIKSQLPVNGINDKLQKKKNFKLLYQITWLACYWHSKHVKIKLNLLFQKIENNKKIDI